MFNIDRPENLCKSDIGALDRDAALNWDFFYKRHAAHFFRDRHYIHKELPALLSAQSILEVGCGVGNTIFPLLDLCSPSTRLWACDFSPTAVDHVKAHAQYDAGRLTAFTADITCDSLAQHMPTGSIEFCTLVFVLSAIAPALFSAVIRNIAGVLVAGKGRIYFRDYCIGDLAEQRLRRKGRSCRLQQRAYCRSDGTRTYFFSEGEVKALFAADGFSCDWMSVEERTVANRATGVTMERLWLQGCFTLSQPVIDRQPSDAATSEVPKPLTAREQDCQWADAGAGAYEWESAGGVAGSDVAAMFWEPVEMQDSMVRLRGGPSLRLQSVAGHHCHTESHTGMQLWSAGVALAELILQCPRTFQWAKVLELGSGAAALPAIAATRSAGLVVATDGSRDSLTLLSSNLAANGGLFFAERLRVRQLVWGDAYHITELQEEVPGRFDLVVGADVVYALDHVAALFATASALLTRNTDRKPVVLLCFTVRSVSEEVVVDLAAKAHLMRIRLPTEVAHACAIVAPTLSDTSTMRVLMFTHKQ